MSDFENMFLKVYNEDILNNTLALSSDFYKALQGFMINHPEDSRTLAVKQWFCDNYQRPFLNPALQQAFNQNNSFPFLQKTIIFSQLPFTLINPQYPNYFYKLLNTPSIYFGNLQNFYHGCFEFFGLQHNLQVPNNLQDLITNFAENEENKPFMHCCKDKYGTLEEELEKLQHKQLLLDNNPCGYTLQELVNQTVGKIGELYTANYITNIKEAFNFQFTARDYGNGFGYDMYFNCIADNMIIENLVEVKTTNKSFYDPGLDSFTITDNELKVMQRAEKSPNARFFIARIYIKDKPATIEALEYKNEVLLPTFATNYYYKIEIKGNTITATKEMLDKPMSLIKK